ncbi:hypothetical protein GYMLUDRAFT_42876 [Collybiopsis luxurians FD-317 M1]|uniref:Uncharacterized protein n=1 Tax=Collybiopsis luxurians FD-317 M1 TaxID=944289 RepID=A0A0D0BC47_9AGAR|nr:hypothetical protein GYMLUDRAFT_42876 [Collybiopsis luxurians FD-317 M1]
MASTTQTLTQTDTIPTSILQGLKSDDPDTRTQSAVELRCYVASTMAQASQVDSKGGENAATLGHFWDAINRQIFDLIHSRDITENFGGLLAIDQLLLLDQYPELSRGTPTLIQVPDNDSESNCSETNEKSNTHLGLQSKQNLSRFYNYVLHILPKAYTTQPDSDPNLTLQLSASHTLGRILHILSSDSSTRNSEWNPEPAVKWSRIVNFQIASAIQLLHPSNTRYAGVLILQEFARHYPAYFRYDLEMSASGTSPSINVSNVSSARVIGSILISLQEHRPLVCEAIEEFLVCLASWHL